MSKLRARGTLLVPVYRKGQATKWRLPLKHERGFYAPLERAINEWWAAVYKCDGALPEELIRDAPPGATIYKLDPGIKENYEK